MWISNLFFLILLCEWSTQNRILEHFEEKLNSINDRVRQTSHTKPYRGRIKRYRCIEEYVTVDEFGNVIEDSVEERKYFTTREPPTIYETVTHLPPIKKWPGGMSSTKITKRLYGVKSVNPDVISTARYATSGSTIKPRRKKKKKSKYSKNKLMKVEIKGRNSMSHLPSILQTPPVMINYEKPSIINISQEDEQNDRLIEKMYSLSSTATPIPTKSDLMKQSTPFPQLVTTNSPFANSLYKDKEENPIRSQKKNASLRTSLPKGYYEYFKRDSLNKPHHLNPPPGVANRPFMWNETRKSPIKTESLGNNAVQVAPELGSEKKVAAPAIIRTDTNESQNHPFSFSVKNKYPHALPNAPTYFSGTSNVSMRQPERVQPKMKKKKEEKLPLPPSNGPPRFSKEKMVPLPLDSPPPGYYKVHMPVFSSSLPKVPGKTVMRPEEMEKFRTETCAKIRSMASSFGISDVSAWAHKNCSTLSMFVPGATCQQIWNFIDSCKRSNFF